MSRPSQNIAALLQAAEVAPPPARDARSCWACFYPVVSKLVANGRNITQAVAWLVEQKAISVTKSKQAYRALLAIHNRKTKPN